MKLKFSILLILVNLYFIKIQAQNIRCGKAKEITVTNQRSIFTDVNSSHVAYGSYWYSFIAPDSEIVVQSNSYINFYSDCIGTEVTSYRKSDGIDTLFNQYRVAKLIVGNRYYIKSTIYLDGQAISFATSTDHYFNAPNQTCNTATLVEQSNIRKTYKADIDKSANELTNGKSSVYFKFKALSASIKINTNKSIPAEINIYKNCNNDTVTSLLKTSISINIDTLYNQTNIRGLNVNDEYIIKFNAYQNFSFAVSEFIPIVNDDSINAILLAEKAEPELILEELQNSTDRNIWYKIKPKHSVLQLNASDFTVISFKDSASISEISIKYYNGKVNINVDTTKTYYLKVSNLFKSNILFVFKYVEPLVNDECNQAKLVLTSDSTENTYYDTVTTATNSNNNITSLDYWIKFVAKTSVVSIKSNSYLLGLYDSCNSVLKTPQISFDYPFVYHTYNHLNIGQTYYVKMPNGINQYSIQNITPISNDECDNATEVIPGNNIITSNIVDLNRSTASPQNSITDNTFLGVNPTMNDVWFKFKATDSKMIVWATRIDIGKNVGIVFYDSCGGKVLGYTSTHYSPNDSTKMVLNNLIVGKTYIYRLVSLGQDIMIVRLDNTSNNSQIVNHGVYSNFSSANNCNAYSQVFNTSQLTKGRKHLQGSNCSNGINDTNTYEQFVDVCLQGSSFSIDIIVPDNKVVFRIELLDSIIANQWNSILCLNSSNNYSNIWGNYKLRIEVSDTSGLNRDFNFSYQINRMPTAVENVKLPKQISFMPNPFSNDLTIKDLKTGDLVELYNCNGDIILSNNVNNSEITLDTQNLSSGLYILKVNGLASKVIKE